MDSTMLHFMLLFQRNTVYKLSYKNPLTYTKPKTKPFKFNLDVIPPKLNDTCRPYKGRYICIITTWVINVVVYYPSLGLEIK